MNVVVPDLFAPRVPEIDREILAADLDDLAVSKARVTHPISNMKQPCDAWSTYGLRHELLRDSAVLRRRERVSPL